MTPPRVRHWWWPALSAVILWATPWPSAWIDQAFSRGFYRLLQPAVTTLSNLAPWTWLDLFIILAVVLVLRRLWLAWQERTGGWAGAVWRLTQRWLRATGLVATVFLVMWGLNYRRTPLLRALGEAPPVASLEELTALARDAAALASAVR